MPDIPIDSETARYIADQAFIRIDMIAWASTALLIALIVRIVATPLIHLIHQFELTTVSVIKALRGK